MTPAFADAIALAHEIMQVAGRVAIGPYCAEVRCLTDHESRQWLSPLIAFDGDRRNDLSIAVVSGRPDLFGHLRPTDSGAVEILDTGRFIVHWDPAPVEILHVLDRETSRGLFWIAGAGAPGWVQSRPLLQLVHAFLLDTPWVPVHAASVGLNGDFLALAGGAGAGKTTAALACGMAGWTYAGDDFVLIDSVEGRVAPLYSSARTRSNAPSTIADLVGRTRVAETDMNGDVRSELRLADHAIGSRIGGGKIKGWLLPQRRGAAVPLFSRSSAAAAYGALMYVTTSHLPFGRPQLAAKVLKALGRAPVYAVDTGNDPSLIPGAFERFIEELRETT